MSFSYWHGKRQIQRTGADHPKFAAAPGRFGAGSYHRKCRYQKLLSDSQNFLKLFEQIELKETDIAQTAEITAALGPAFAKEYGIGIGSAAALTAAQLSRRCKAAHHSPCGPFTF